MTAWIAIVGGGLVTYLARGSFIAFSGNRPLPASAQRLLRYVSPAVFAALVLPSVLGDKGLSRFASPDARLLALFVGGLFAWRSRNLAGALVVGMVALWLLRWAGL